MPKLVEVFESQISDEGSTPSGSTPETEKSRRVIFWIFLFQGAPIPHSTLIKFFTKVFFSVNNLIKYIPGGNVDTSIIFTAEFL